MLETIASMSSSGSAINELKNLPATVPGVARSGVVFSIESAYIFVHPGNLDKILLV